MDLDLNIVIAIRRSKLIPASAMKRTFHEACITNGAGIVKGKAIEVGSGFVRNYVIRIFIDYLIRVVAMRRKVRNIRLLLLLLFPLNFLIIYTNSRYFRIFPPSILKSLLSQFILLFVPPISAVIIFTVLLIPLPIHFYLITPMILWVIPSVFVLIAYFAITTTITIDFIIRYLAAMLVESIIMIIILLFFQLFNAGSYLVVILWVNSVIRRILAYSSSISRWIYFIRGLQDL